MRGSPIDELLKSLVDDFALVKAGTLKAIIKAIVRQQPKPGRGMRAVEMPDGLIMEVDSEASAKRPFDPIFLGGDGDFYYLRLTPGQIRQSGMTCSPVPTYFGVSLLSSPLISVPASGVSYLVIATIVYDPEVVLDWVTSAVVTALTVSVVAETAMPEDVAGLAYLPLAGIGPTGEVFGLVSNNVTVVIDDNGTATGTAAVHTFFGVAAE